MSGPGGGPGDGAGLQVDLQALRHDSATWHEASRRLGGPIQQLSRLTVDAPAFSFLGEDAGLPGMYAAMIEHVHTLLGQAQQVTDGIGATLQAAADTYEAEDRAGAHRFGAPDPARPGGPR